MNSEPRTASLKDYLLPRIGELLFLTFFVAVIALGPRLMNQDGDLGRHLTLGDHILDSGSIPTRDIFSFTKLGDPLTPHEWLADVIFSLANRIGGLDGVVWVTALIIAVSMWLTYKFASKVSGMPLLAMLAAVLAAAASSLHWLSRPHIFTILFSIFWIYRMDRVRTGEDNSWLQFPLLMLIWVNLHGAFFAGFAIWLAYVVGSLFDEGIRSKSLLPLIKIGVSSALVTLLNPDGIGIWKTGVGFLGSRYLVSHTAEYLPPDFQNSSTWPFLLLILLCLLGPASPFQDRSLWKSAVCVWGAGA